MSESLNTIPKDVVGMIQQDYEDRVNDSMGHLYNRFVGFISESKVPLPQVVVVLQMLLHESMQLAKERYIG